MKNYNDLGEDAENRTEEGIKILIKRNPFFIYYIRAKKYGELDSRKVDFIIFMQNLMALPLQIKTSIHAVREHYQKCPYILALNIRKNDSPQKISDKIERYAMKLIKDAQKNRQRIKYH